MRYLYVDNFRGFSDTYIPIKDVNFLVGENSTGKTSILSLIHLLGSPRFWLYSEFNTDEVQLGHFSDIVSVNSDNKNYFRIGVVECQDGDDEDKQGSTDAFLMTFGKEKGLPILKRYRAVLEKEEQVEAIFSAKTISYKVSPLELCGESQDDSLKMFKQWVSESGENLQDSKRLNLDKLPGPRTAVLAFFMSFIERPSEEKTAPAAFLKIPPFAYPFAWIAPIRSKPKITYDSYRLDPTPGGDHAPYLIRRMLSRRSSDRDFKSFVEAFGVESGLFESVYIKKFGRDSTAPFELGVIIGNSPLKHIYVGYGVSQVLPVVAELFARQKRCWFAIQQPEVHLHPKAQAALGDLFFKMATEENKRFFIETHSDYIIDRFRLNLRDSQGETEIDCQVLFFERTDTGNRVYRIEIKDDGKYPKDQPESFREFFINENVRLLGL